MPVFVPYKYNPSEMPDDDLEAIFVGRQYLLDRLVAAVREQTYAETIQHYLLLGPRGIGKTTLLRVLHRRVQTDPELASRWLPARYREEEFYVYTLRDLLALALEYLHEEEGLSEADAVLRQAEAEANNEQSQAKILDGLRKICVSHRKRILLLIDNFDQIFSKSATGDLDQRTFRKLLSTESFLMVVGASTLLFEDIFSYDEAFFNFFSPVPVENLNDEEVQALLHARANLDENHDFLRDYEEHREKVRAITYLTGGNPRLVLMLYEILSQRQFLPVVQALRATVDNLTPLLKDVLEDLPRQQSKVLDALMRLGGVASPSEIAERARLPLNAVTTQVGRLKGARLIEVQGEGRGKPAICRVSDQMFRTWYQMRYLRPARRRVELFVEFLRAWFTVEDRVALLGQLRKEFETSLSSGLQRQARETAFTMEYFAASLDDPSERIQQLEYVADAYLAAGDIKEAAFILADLHAQEVQSEMRYETVGYMALGNRLVKKGDLLNAVQSYSEVLKKDIKNAQARINLGICFGELGESEKAIEEFTKILDAQDENIILRCRVYFNRGVAKGSQGNIKGAISDYDEVMKMKRVAPSDIIASALNNRGIQKVNTGDTQGAISDYSEVLALENVPPDLTAAALNNRARYKAQLGDIEGAISDYNMVSSLNEVSSDIKATALIHSGYLKSKLENFEEEIADYTSALSLEGLSPYNKAVALYNRGVRKGKLRDFKGAILDFTEVLLIKEAPSQYMAMSLRERGIYKERLGDLDGAIADFTETLSLNDVPPEEIAKALIDRGVRKGRRGDFEGALEDFRSVLSLEESLPKQRAMALYNRGMTKDIMGDRESAIADYTSVLVLDGAPPDGLAMALNNRAAIKGKLGDIQGEIADYTAILEIEGVPSTLVATALNNRGVAKSNLGNIKGAIEDYSTVLELKDASPKQIAIALHNRGHCKGLLSDNEGAIADYTAVLELKGISPEQIAKALNDRGASKGRMHDIEGAILDFTAVFEIDGVLPDQRAKALYNLGVSKNKVGDDKGAILEYTAVLEVKGASSEQLAMALNGRAMSKKKIDDMEGAIKDYTATLQIENAPPDQVANAFNERGVTKGQVGDVEGTISDFTAVLQVKGAPPEEVAKALYNRGVSKDILGDTEGAITDYTRCAESSSDISIIHHSIGSLIRLLCQKNRTDEAIHWMARIDELEPEKVPTEQRLEARISIIVAVAQMCSLDAATALLDTLLNTAPSDLRERLAFLKPGLIFAQDGDESTLAKLPQEEQEMARRIAATVKRTA